MNESDWWYLDLCLAIVYAGGAIFAIIVGIGGVIRLVIAIPLVVFLPGYAFVSMLYPDRGGEHKPFDETQTGLHNPIPPHQGLTRTERVTLAVVASVMIVPAIALAAAVSPWRVSLLPIMWGIGLCTAVFALIGILMRYRCPPERRFAPSIPRMGFSPEGKAGRKRHVATFNTALLLSALLLGASIGYAAIDPPDADGYTEFYVDTEEVTGDVEETYQASYVAGETDELTVHVANEEGHEVEYSVVILLQRVEYLDDEVRVQEEDHLATHALEASDGDLATESIEMTPTMSGDDLRLVVLLYDDEVPDDPDESSAYRELSLPVVVD